MVTKSFKIALIVSQIIIGSLLTIINKAQSSIYVYEGPFYRQSFHPYIQVLTMFIGELLCLPIFLVLRWKNPRDYQKREQSAIQQGKKVGMNKFYLLVPTMCDLLTSALNFFALNFISVSGYQMFSGGDIITCFIFTVFFLKVSPLRSQTAGAVLSVIGILIVGLANIFNGDSQQEQSEYLYMEIVGYILLILSLFTSGFLYIFQQKLLNIYHLQPLMIVGYEGLFGLIITVITVVIFSYVPCDFGVDACVFTQQGYGFIQGWRPFLNDMFDNGWLLFLNICWILNVTAFNPLGVSITKYINGVARAICDVSQTILVWAVGIIITLGLGNTYPNFSWQKLNLFVILFQSIGFFFLMFGNLIYNQIIEPKILKNQKKQKDDTQQEEYTHTESLLTGKKQSKQQILTV